MTEVFKGKVIFFSNERGYGFIEWSKGDEKQKDLFVHYSDIVKDGFKSLTKDKFVTFKLGKNRKDIDKAIEVQEL